MSSSAQPKYPEKKVSGPILTKPNGLTYQLTTTAVTPRVATTERLRLDSNYLRIPDPAKEPIYPIHPIHHYYLKDNDHLSTITDNEYINEENGRYILYTRPSNSAAAGPTPPPVEVFITPATFRKIDATNMKSASTQPEKEMYEADPDAMKALRDSIQASIQAKKSAAAKPSRKRSTRKRRSSRKRRA
jgi:hypothetical protein